MMYTLFFFPPLPLTDSCVPPFCWPTQNGKIVISFLFSSVKIFSFVIDLLPPPQFEDVFMLGGKHLLFFFFFSHISEAIDLFFS